MMAYWHDMLRMWYVHGEDIWMWALRFGLPCWVMGMWLMGYGLWGRKVMGEVRCGGCGKVVGMRTNQEIDVCADCGCDLRKKRGVRWGRVKRWRTVMMGGLVMLLPMCSWGVMLMVTYYKVHTRQVYEGMFMKHMRNDILIYDYADTNENGSTDAWSELVLRMKAGELSAEEIKAMADVHCDSKTNTKDTNWHTGVVFLDAYEQGILDDARCVRISKRGYEFDQSRFTMGSFQVKGVDEEKGEMMLQIRKTPLWGYYLSERLVAVKTVEMDGDEVAFEVDWDQCSDDWIEVVLRLENEQTKDWDWKKLGKAGDHKVKVETRVVYVDLKDSAGIDSRTREADWPKRVLDEEVMVFEGEM